MADPTEIVWRQTDVRFWRLRLIITTGDLMWIVGIGTPVGGFVVTYGRYSHALNLMGGWNSTRPLWRRACEQLIGWLSGNGRA